MCRGAGKCGRGGGRGRIRGRQLMMHSQRRRGEEQESSSLPFLPLSPTASPPVPDAGSVSCLQELDQLPMPPAPGQHLWCLATVVGILDNGILGGAREGGGAKGSRGGGRGMNRCSFFKDFCHAYEHTCLCSTVYYREPNLIILI